MRRRLALEPHGRPQQYTLHGVLDRHSDSSDIRLCRYTDGWADLEAHYPGIDSLKLPRDVAATWKQRVMTRTRTTTGPTGDRPVCGHLATKV